MSIQRVQDLPEEPRVARKERKDRGSHATAEAKFCAFASISHPRIGWFQEPVTAPAPSMPLQGKAWDAWGEVLWMAWTCSSCLSGWPAGSGPWPWPAMPLVFTLKVWVLGHFRES